MICGQVKIEDINFYVDDMFWHRTDKIGAECVNGSPCVNSLALNIRVYCDGWQHRTVLGPEDKARHSCKRIT